MRKILLSLFLMMPIIVNTSTEIDSYDLTELTIQMNREINNYKEMVRLDSMKRATMQHIKVFLYALGQRESSNNPDTFNTLGYIGKYQFGKLALKDVGLDHVSYEKFVEDRSIFPEELQDSAVIKLMKLNEKRLEQLIDKYEHKVIAGIYITRSGILAAAHLSGARNVQKFFRSNGHHNPADAYGTKLSDYLKEFSGYNIDLAYL